MINGGTENKIKYRSYSKCMKDLRAQFATNMDNFNNAFNKLKKALGEK